MATRLRNGVKLHLGTRTEKVIEFGIRPLRKPARHPKVIEVQVPIPKESPAEASEPTQTTP